MAYYFGKEAYLSMALQAELGTAAPSFDIHVPITKEPGIKGVAQREPLQELRKTTAEATAFTTTRISAEGNMTMPLYPQGGMEHVMYGVFGAKATAQQGATAAYKHTFTIGSTLPVFTIGVGRASQNIDKFQDVVFGSLDIGFEPGGALELSTDVKGKPLGIGTGEVSPSYTTDRAYAFTDVDVSLGGASNCDITNLSLKIDRGVKSERSACAAAGLYDNMIYPTTTSVEGSFDMYFQDYDEYKYWLGASDATTFSADASVATMKRAIVITATGANISGIYDNEFQITIPSAVYSDADISTPYDDRMKVRFDFRAYYDSAQDPGKEVVHGYVQSELTSIAAPEA